MDTHLNIIQPTLLLDTDKCRQNIDRMCTKMQRNNIVFRPHFKTHQSREIGRWFRDYSVDRITVSSLRMALYFADDGWKDITVAFPVNLLEKDIINNLAGRIQLNLIAEDPDVITKLDSILQHRVHMFLKIDTGTHRTGIEPTDVAKVDACVRAMANASHLEWKGFVSHAGHTYHLHHKEPSIHTLYQDALQGMIVLRDAYRTKYPDILISFGDTPGASILEDFKNIDEMRPGNFVFYDMMQVQIGSCTMQDVAVAMLCPVVACHPQRHECIVYGGGIHFAKDSIIRDDGHISFGTVVSHTDGRREGMQEIGYMRSLSQEHGIMHMSPETEQRVFPGQLIAVLPVHSCMTAQCMAGYLDHSGERIDHFAGTKYYLQ